MAHPTKPCGRQVHMVIGPVEVEAAQKVAEQV